MATPQWAMSGDEHGDEQDEQRVDAELASKKVWALLTPCHAGPESIHQMWRPSQVDEPHPGAGRDGLVHIPATIKGKEDVAHRGG